MDRRHADALLLGAGNHQWWRTRIAEGFQSLDEALSAGLVWEEVTDAAGEVKSILEINSEYYIYEIVLNNAKTGTFNRDKYPVIMHRYTLEDQSKPLDTRHCVDEEEGMAIADRWETITLRAHNAVCQPTPS